VVGLQYGLLLRLNVFVSVNKFAIETCNKTELRLTAYIWNLY